MVRMARRRFEIAYGTRVKGHLAAIERKYHAFIRRSIEQQLTFEPDTETRNRKPLLREIEL